MEKANKQDYVKITNTKEKVKDKPQTSIRYLQWISASKN